MIAWSMHISASGGEVITTVVRRIMTAEAREKVGGGTMHASAVSPYWVDAHLTVSYASSCSLFPVAPLCSFGHTRFPGAALFA